MGVLDLKTDLSKYRKPASKSVVKQADSSGVIKDFASKQPLLDLAKKLPNRTNIEKNVKKTTEEIKDDSHPAGRHDKGVNVPKDNKPIGRHTVQINENPPKTNPTGRHDESNIRIIPSDPSLAREGVDVNKMPATPAKHGENPESMPVTPIKKGTDAHLLPSTPPKTPEQLQYVNFFNDIASGTKGFVPYMDKTLYIGVGGVPGAWTFTTPFVNTQLGVADYFKNPDANGFTTFQIKTQYKQITGPTGAKKFESVYINTKLGYTNVFNDIDATGFTPYMQSSQYIGITGQAGAFQFATAGNTQDKVGSMGTPQSFADGHSGTIVTGKQKGFQPTGIDKGYSLKDTYGAAIFKDYTGLTAGGVIIRTNRYTYKTTNWYKDFVPKEAPIGISPLTKIYKIPNAYGRHLDPGNRPWLGTPNRLAAPEVNYFNGPGLSAGIDDAALGFKKMMTPRVSMFIGIDEDKYFYPDLTKGGKRLMEVPLDPTDAAAGIAKLEAGAGETAGTQLGIGSPFKSWSGNTKITGQPGGTENIKIFTPGGYDSNHKYGGADGYNPDAVKGRLKSVYTDGSPIDGIYSKYNLRDEAYNPTYMKQPFIVRGIQKAGVIKNQRWGLGNFFADAQDGELPPGAQGILQVVSALDGGFIRGGISTAIHRSVADTVRVAKFMVSPKGITWLATQVGLQMTNPNVEKFPLATKRPTKLYNLGINTLTSVIGSAFGLHFKRHGLLPFGPSPNYEDIVTTRNWSSGRNLKIEDPSISNRLLVLRDQLDVTRKGEPGIGNIIVGMNIPYLTATGGPGSVYGIGRTGIKRWMVSTPPGINSLGYWTDRTYYKYNSSYQYYKTPEHNGPVSFQNSSNPFYKNTGDDTWSNDLINIDTGDPSYIPSSIGNTDYLQRVELFGISGSLGRNKKDAPPGWNKSRVIEQRDAAKTWKQKYPSKTEHKNLSDGQKAGSLERSINSAHDGNAGSIKDYAVLSYGKLKKPIGQPKRISKYNDFRTDVFEQDSTKDYKLMANPKNQGPVTFANKNMDSFYGFNKDLDPSQINRTSFTASLGKADKVNMYDFQKVSLDSLKKLGPNDLIEFWFQGPEALTKDAEAYAMVFRATITGLTDNFTGNWSNHQMVGRGDPVYTYTGHARNLAFNFRVAATTREEMKFIWRKLNYLASYTAPDYISGGAMKSPFLRLTLGGLFQNTPGFLTSVTYTIPDAASWEINIEDDPAMKQVPQVVDVAVAFTPVLDYRATQNGRMYSLSNNGKHTANPKDTDGNVTRWDNWLDGPSKDGKSENAIPTSGVSSEETYEAYLESMATEEEQIASSQDLTQQQSGQEVDIDTDQTAWEW